MFCSKCGKEIPDDSVFCPECGQDVRRPTTPTPAATITAPVSPVSGGVSQGMLVGIIIASIFIPLLGMILGIIYMRDQSPAKKRAGKIWLWVGIGMVIIWTLYWADGGA